MARPLNSKVARAPAVRVPWVVESNSFLEPPLNHVPTEYAMRGSESSMVVVILTLTRVQSQMSGMDARDPE